MTSTHAKYLKEHRDRNNNIIALDLEWVVDVLK